MAKHVEEARQFQVGDDVLAKAIPYALRRAGAVDVHWNSAREAVARFPVNGCSWGEAIVVRI